MKEYRTIFLSDSRRRGFNCLVFDIRDGKMFGYVTGNSLRHSENVETLAGQLGIPTRYIAWYNDSSGNITYFDKEAFNATLSCLCQDSDH